MPPTDDAELRALQAKAYGRGGGLSDAEAARLRELEETRGGVPEATRTQAVVHAQEENSPSGGGIEADPPPERVNSARAREPAEPHDRDSLRAHDGVAAPAPAATRADPRRALRRHWRPVAAASAVLLAIGVGAGWMLFGRGALPIAVPAGQEAAFTMLQGEAFDDGSVKFIGEKHDVAVWRATAGEGVRECIILTHGDQKASDCRPDEQEPTTDGFIGLSTGIDFEEDGETVSVWATIMPDITGEWVTLVQRSVHYAGDWRDQYSDEEIAAVERLEAAGFDPFELYLAGYDGDQPIWQGHLDGANCIAAVVDSEVVRGCVDIADDTLQLRVGETLYEIVQTTNRGPVLTIIRGVGDTGETGQPLELGGEHGDPIEVSPESPNG